MEILTGMILTIVLFGVILSLLIWIHFSFKHDRSNSGFSRECKVLFEYAQQYYGKYMHSEMQNDDGDLDLKQIDSADEIKKFEKIPIYFLSSSEYMNKRDD